MSKARIRTLISAFGLVCVSVSASAQDEAVQETGEVELSSADMDGAAAGSAGPLRFYGGFRIGFGGEVENDPDGGTSSDDDLLATPGLQLGADYVLMDYFAAGAELRFGWTNSDFRDDNDVGRDLFVDIDVKPRGRYQLSNIPLEVYATLPLGLTLIATNDDTEDLTGGNELSQGPGFNLGIGGGATYFFSDHLGVNAEMAYLLYWWGAEVDNGGESDLSAGQFTLFFNAVYAL